VHAANKIPGHELDGYPATGQARLPGADIGIRPNPRVPRVRPRFAGHRAHSVTLIAVNAALPRILVAVTRATFASVSITANFCRASSVRLMRLSTSPRFLGGSQNARITS